MAALHPQQKRFDHHSHARRLRYQATLGQWNTPDPIGLRTGLALTGIGLSLLVGSVLLALVTGLGYAGFLFLFLGSPFLIYGSMLILIDAVERAARRLRRVKSHCGRCRFYAPLEGQYGLGRCLAAPSDDLVHRTDSCPFFSYSERAMVRDRFAQRAESLERLQRATRGSKPRSANETNGR